MLSRSREWQCPLPFSEVKTVIRVSIRIHQMNWWKESIESNQYATFQEYEDENENTIYINIVFLH